MSKKVYGGKTHLAQELHAMKYRSEGESFKEAQNRFASALTDTPEEFYALREILLEQRFMGGGRTQLAVGSPHHTTAFNCFVSGVIEDSFDSIMDNAKQAGQTMRKGGGIGYDFSNLRPKGAPIKSLGSSSSGVLSFMHIFDSICKTIASAGHRRGAQMGVLRIDHPSIEEFIHAKQNTTELTAFNLSVGVTDKFMNTVVQNEDFDLVFDGRVTDSLHASTLWEQVMRTTWDWAEPGILFIDRINEMNNLWYCENIMATNPCLHPDSLVETIDGRVRIADIKEPTMVYTRNHDGSLGIAKASAAYKSKSNAKVMRIRTWNHKEIVLTPDHKVLTHDRGWIQARDLNIGDRVVQLCRARRGAAYSGVKLTIESNRAYRMEHHMVAESVYGRIEPVLYDVHHIDGDTYNNSIDNLEVLSHSAHSNYTATFDNPQTHQQHGDNGCFVSTGVSPKTVIPMPAALRSNIMHSHGNSIVDISYDEVASDVYDITVEGTHNFIANFMVVHNCGEQPLPPYGACLLGSFNLTKYIVGQGKGYMFDLPQFDADIIHVVRAMDNIHDETVFPLPEQAAESHAKRRMGIGVTGLANALEILGHSYGSATFLYLASTIFTHLRDGCYRASVQLAKEKGAFPMFDAAKYCKGKFIKTLPKSLQRDIRTYGIRNSHLVSFAPTGTISLTADNVSGGIEPVFSHEYNRIVQLESGAVTEVVKDYAWNYYGVKGKTANECTVDDHLNVLILATKFVDSAVSKTINVSPDMPWDEFKDIYMRAWKGGCKGCTTFNSGGKRFGILTETAGDEVKACYIDEQTGQKECS